MPEIDHNALAFLMALVGAILGGSGAIGFFKLRPDNRKTSAEADKTAAESWAILVLNQRNELSSLSLRIAALEKSMDEKTAQLRQERDRNTELETENCDLKDKIADLEAENEALKARVAALEEKMAVIERKRGSGRAS